ncbi:hypothetical protein Scep_024492 [Stephania cephalantha]|uniref:Uncharacterized protein n=1 Tax=Stephania cephalantha TaxID=152367 RepID=A0AAP0EZI9_9MAGN
MTWTICNLYGLHTSFLKKWLPSLTPPPTEAQFSGLPNSYFHPLTSLIFSWLPTFTFLNIVSLLFHGSLWQILAQPTITTSIAVAYLYVQ